MDKVLSASQYLIFVNLTSFMTILGGVVLWLGFIIMGLVSRRYEQVLGKATHWQSQMVAPAGMFIYLLMQAIASLRHHNMGSLELWTGYTLLAWSAGLAFWACFQFYKMLTKLEQENE